MTHLELVDATVKFGALVALNGVTLQADGPAKLGSSDPTAPARPRS